MERRSVPWASFSALQTALEAIMNDRSFPNGYDQSSLPFTGTYKAQLLSTLEFLGFLDRSHMVTEVLRSYKDVPARRRSILAKQLRASYPGVFSHKVITEAAIENEIAKYRVTGSTRRKAIVFFIKAAQFAGIEVEVEQPIRHRGGAILPVTVDAPEDPSSDPVLVAESTAVYRAFARNLDHIPPVMLALLRELPAPNTDWSQDKHRHWFGLFESAYQYYYGVPASPKQTTGPN